MDLNGLDRIKNWFETYVSAYAGGDPEYSQNILLKINHSRRVADNIVLLARSEGLAEDDVALASAVGILHDAGRFPQYRQYRTFKDSISLNHGELGSEIIAKEGVLDGLSSGDSRLVHAAVRYHNAHKVPHLGDGRAELFIRLVRDADKVDIWRVLLEEFYELAPEHRASSAGLSLPDATDCTPGLAALIDERRVIRLSELQNLKDFILMLMSWCYDMNFKASYRMLLERGYFERYRALLGRDEAALRALDSVRDYAQRRAGQ